MKLIFVIAIKTIVILFDIILYKKINEIKIKIRKNDDSELNLVLYKVLWNVFL